MEQRNYNRNRRKSSRRSSTSRRTSRKPSNKRKNSGRHVYRGRKRKLNKKRVALVVIIFALIIMGLAKLLKKEEQIETSSNEDIVQVECVEKPIEQPIENPVQEQPKVKNEIADWRLTIANYENILPDDFQVEVEEIADDRLFDARAIDDLKKMINAMGRDGIANIWVQSAYRSVERQKELYDNSVQKYLKQGKTQEEAERLTDEYINKPGASDHNLGLAVDFNNVDNKFEDLDGFRWLQKNAENYGFILRYPKDKEEITKIAYESWHWRYVGEEHAKKMNKLNMCLEEYIEYLENEDTVVEWDD